ncbi:hypothetical protein N2152v2_001271 [Parachlorella kessleri]
MGWNVCIPDGFGTELFGCTDEPELQLKGAAQKAITDRKEDWFSLLKKLEGGASLEEVAPLCYLVAEGLVRGGAALVNVVDSNGASPLHWAALGHGRLVEFLLEHGAKADMVDEKGLTPLGWAAKPQARHGSEVATILKQHLGKAG